MGLSMRSKKEVSKEYAMRYQKASKGGKTEILNSFIELTGYNRCYASYILRNWGKKVFIRGGNGDRFVMVGEFVKKRSYRRRCRKYDESVLKALIIFWKVLNFPCGKRLKPQLPELVKKARRFRELKIPQELNSKLNQISASTIDRLLKPVRKKYELKCRAKTKPGTLLKKQIAIRTGTDWKEDEVGYTEVDLVSHDGGNTRGDFCQTLNMVDVKCGWTEPQAVKNKARVWVFEALEVIKDERLPFPLKGIDSDNGGEFINAHLIDYCEQKGIKFTCSRPSNKNDNCYVEEKNFTAVRNYVGHYRYDNEEQRTVLNELYSYLRLYLNYFQPLMKLKSKERIGSKVIKKYDKPKTPYHRLLEMEEIEESKKNELKAIYKELNPFELKRNIEKIQKKLFKMVYLKRKGVHINREDYEYQVSTL